MGASSAGRHVVLVGLMGVGKSTVGRRLAKDLQRPFADVDEHVELRTGRTIPAIFRDTGEDGFRAREEELVLELLADGHDAVSLGGGAILSAAVRESLRDHVVVWMKVPVSELWLRAEGSGRPLAADRVTPGSSGRAPGRAYGRPDPAAAAATAATTTHSVAPKTRSTISLGPPTIAGLSRRTNAPRSSVRCMSIAISTLWVWS